MPWRILRYIHHQFFLRHRKGRGIHSPYLFDFVYNVIFNASRTEVPDWLREEHRKLREDLTLIPVDTLYKRSYAKQTREKAVWAGTQTNPDTGNGEPESRSGRGTNSKGSWGAGSRLDHTAERSVRAFVRKSSVSEKYGALLYRITRWFRPEMILELGTGMGVSTLYLAAGQPEVPLHTMEGNTERAAFAAQLFCRIQLEQVSIHWGDLDEKLEGLLPQVPGRFMAFLDANHRYEPTLRYTRSIIECAENEAIIVMDDIYWSREMYRAWKEVISWPEVRMSIDLFRTGILLLRKDLHKTDLKINF